MSSDTKETGVNRRRFIKASVAAAAAATVAGSSVVLLREKKVPTVADFPAPPVRELAPAPSNNNQQIADLYGRLASAQADNVRLQAQLKITKRQLEAKRSSGISRKDEETENLRTRLDEAIQQVGVMSGLLVLYDQLEEIDFEEIVNSGLETVGDAFDDLVDNVPAIAAGLEMGQLALDELEEQIPSVEQGRNWLAGQLDSVNSQYGAIDRSLRRAVEGGGSFINMLNEWFQGVLKWLPFGIGDKASEIMIALSDLMEELPDTLDGLETRIIEPLDVWFKRDGEETRLQQQVISPVRENALTPAALSLQNTETLHSTFRTHLVEPVEAKVERKQAIRRSIGEYRQSHQV